MGKNRRFINMTGVPNFSNINHGLSLFKSTCNVGKIFDFQINSISFKVRLMVSQDKFNDFLKKKPGLFNVKCFPKFSGVCFKHEKIRVSGNYFRKSNLMVVMGCKSIGDIANFISDVEAIGFIRI